MKFPDTETILDNLCIDIDGVTKSNDVEQKG